MLLNKKQHSGFYVHTIEKRKRIDPTKTTVLRTRFARAMRVRFNDLKQAIRKSIVDNDGFGLSRNKIRVHKVEPGSFDFTRSADKHAAFMDWLKQAQSDGILQVRRGTPIASAASNSWMNVYIDTAYQRGIQTAAMQLRAAGGQVSDRWISAAFNQPIHADRVGLIYTRNYNELTGITDAMDQKISRVLAEGLANGDGAEDLADNITSVVDGIGEARAEMLARTEVIAAHAEGQLNSFAEAGVEGVNLLAEWATAGDDAVCPECQDKEGEQMSIDDARGEIPLHPNCRCAWIPVVNDPESVDLQ
jgi:SPP1 gp7 family putative phage head morphogenesis protein